MIMSTFANTEPPGAGRPEAATIETTRLSLTALHPDDLGSLIKLYGDRDTARMTHAVPHPLTSEDAGRLLAEMTARPHVHWAIRLPDARGEDRLLGVISLTRSACGRAGGIHSFGPNLSIFITPEHRGHGYALEAIDGLIDWVKRRRLHRVLHAAHFADNEASARLLVAADFLYTGRRTMETSRAREGEHLALHMIRIL